MKKLAVIILFSILSPFLYAQRGQVSLDLFKNLEYKSNSGSYKATLEQDILDNIIFKDNNQNKVTYSKTYLKKYFPNLLGNQNEKTRLLRQLVRKNGQDRNYVASFEIDILGKEIFKDNRGNKSESGIDTFGHEYYSEQNEHGNHSIKRDVFGVLQYQENGATASFGKDIFKKWIYKDSKGNEIQFNEQSYNKLFKYYNSDNQVLMFLVDQFLFDERF